MNSEHPRSVFSGYRKCCMNVAHCGETSSQGKTQTVFLNFRLENPIAKCKADKEDKINFPREFKIRYHSLSRSHLVNQDIYTEMFNSGMPPSSAQTEGRKSIKSEFSEVFADRSRLPSLFWVYSMHTQWLDNIVSSRDGVDSYLKAEEMVQDFDKECKMEVKMIAIQRLVKVIMTILLMLLGKIQLF